MRTPGAGRKKGTPNKSTAIIRALAQEYGPEAIAFYVEVMNDDDYPVEARLAAARALLDRGYGRPSQPISVQHTPQLPDHFAWVPPDRLQQMSAWMAEAKAAMERGEPRADALPALPERTLDAVVVDEPEPTV